jgi:hypothetical protein
MPAHLFKVDLHTLLLKKILVYIITHFSGISRSKIDRVFRAIFGGFLGSGEWGRDAGALREGMG